MQTDDLIALLATNVEPVDRGRLVGNICAAVAVGAALALAFTLFSLGIRQDLNEAGSLISVLLKLAFTTGSVVPASIFLTRLARPGGERKTPIAFAALPFVAIALLAAVSLTFAPGPHWDKMIAGDRWLECLLSIPAIAIVPFVAVIWALRQTAPTDLPRTGAFAGLVAGGISATAYALHCTADSLSFVSFWYGGTIALCTLAGAKLGPRLLRW
jgi:hypothetical protein